MTGVSQLSQVRRVHLSQVKVMYMLQVRGAYLSQVRGMPTCHRCLPVPGEGHVPVACGGMYLTQVKVMYLAQVRRHVPVKGEGHVPVTGIEVTAVAGVALHLQLAPAIGGLTGDL